MSQEIEAQAPTPSANPPLPGKITYEEFIEWADEVTWAEWIDGEVIPLRRQAEFYHLGIDGIFTAVAIGDDGIFRSTVLEGLWLKVDWLWQDPLPPLMTVLKEWGLVK